MNNKNNKTASSSDSIYNKIKTKLIIGMRMRDSKNYTLPIVFLLIAAVLFFFIGNNPSIEAKDPTSYQSMKDGHAKITFTGDVSPSRYLKDIAKNQGPDVFYKDIKTVWQDSDISIANVEAAVVRDDTEMSDHVSKPKINQIYLDTSKSDIEAMKEAGLSLIGYANNHAMDYGVTGLIESLDVFEEVGIDYTGAGRNIDEAVIPYTEMINGTNYSLTAITWVSPKPVTGGSNLPRINKLTSNYALYDLERTFSSHDFNIVYVHWGTEYGLRPNQEIQDMGRHLIDLGADVVVGAHPHVLFPVEKYKDGIIAYSLGNTVFDQAIGRTTTGAIANLYHKGDDKFIEFNPIKIVQGVPHLTSNKANQDAAFDLLTKYLDSSEYEIIDGKLVISF